MDCPNCRKLRVEIRALRMELEQLQALVESSPGARVDPLPPEPRPAPRTEKPEDGAPVSLPLQRDELYDDAVKIITEFGHASLSVLQLWLSVGYGRARKILDQLEGDGMISFVKGSSEGKVLPKAYELRRLIDKGA